jgi:serine/threonine protein kinase
MFVARKTIATRNASKSDKLSLNDALRREKSVLQKLLALGTDHRHLVELFASYKLDGNYYLLLTCADYDLEDLFDKNSGPPEFGTTAEQQSATLYGSLYCLASALDYLHRLPNHHPDLGLSEIIYHHDLKPANILIKGKKFLVADFGLSGLKHQDDTKTDWHGGTYSYSPPEYLSSFKTTSASGGRQVDIWSLGCIFSEIVTLAIKGWRSDSVSRFKSWRANGPSVHLFNPDAPDSSFHNNLPEVKSWLHDILAKDGNSLTSLVGIIDRTLSIEPAKRPSSEILCQDLTRVLPRGYLDICGCART